jgi:DNA-binding IscR family transcriptional regulator
MAGLREAGYVRSEKGHGGGWTLAKDLRTVSLLDIYKAIGGPTIFAIGNINDNPQCAVERVVNEAMDDALSDAEALLLKRFASVALSDLAQRFDEISSASGWDADHPLGA